MKRCVPPFPCIIGGEYVFGVYNSLIVAVYKPSEWFVCKEAKDRLPGQDIVFTPKIENRLFFCG